MLWKFSFASSSNVDTLLTRENPPELEEVLDEQDILSEVKAQNNRLITFLSKEDHIKSLLQWVVAGLDELDQAAERSDTASFKHALASPHLFPAFQLSPISAPATSAAPPPAPGPGSPPLEPAKMVDEPSTESSSGEAGGAGGDGQTPYSPDLPAALGQGLGNKEGDDDAKRARYPLIATEILTSELWTISETIMQHKDHLLRPFWDAVLGDPDQPTSLSAEASEEEMSLSRHEQTEKDRARDEFWSDEDEERHRQREVIRGYWTRVNGSLLQKRPQEMFYFIMTVPNVVERMINRIESPAIQDMIVRLITAEQNGLFGVTEWLAEQGLISRLVAYLSPEYPPTLHVIAAELLKGIVSVCAPVPFDPQGGNAEEQASAAGGPGGPGGAQGGPGAGPGAGAGAGSKNNRLIREMVSHDNVASMVGFMLDDVGLSDRNWHGLNGPDGPAHPADPFVVHPLPSISSASSSMSQICMLLVELIRRNNSDFSEPHLFHTLRNRLMNIRTQQLQAQQESGIQPSESDERDAMEAAMSEISPLMGIVHLGDLLSQVIVRFGDLHHFLLEPRSQIRAASNLHPKPLTTERFRIVELYAELLHSSNMSIFNRIPGSGPTYTSAGVLSGGLDSLEALGTAIDGDRDGPGDGGEADGEGPEGQVTQARELPISAGSTDVSISGSSDIPSDDEAVLEAADETTPSQSPSASRTLELPGPASGADANPPPPSQADVVRLRGLRDSEVSAVHGGAGSSDRASVSHAAVAASTTAPSVASDHPTEGGRAPLNAPAGDDTGHAEQDPELSLGDHLKSQYLQFKVIPTIVDLFFEYPHNDFAHHVIYDLLQQVLNGRLTPGLNRELVIEMIKEARLVERILDAQRANDRLASEPRKPRLPFMGHIILIAEEMVKFFAKCPADLFAIIGDSFVQSEWLAFADGALQETRDRDTRPLAGGKPMQAGPSSDIMGPKSDDDSSDDDDEAALEAQKFGEPLTRTMAQGGYSRGGGDGYEAYEDRHESGDDDDSYWRGMSESRKHVDSSDEDDDDDADWLRPSVRNAARGGDIGSDDDDFAGFQSGSSRVQHLDDFDDDEAWGNFSTAGTSQAGAAAGVAAGDNVNPFDDFRPDPLTPHDWASKFDSEFNESWDQTDDPASREARGNGSASADANAPTIVMPSPDDDGADADAESFSPRPGSTWSFTGVDEGEDLPPTTSPTMEDAPQLGGEKVTPASPPTQGMSGLSLSAPRDASGQVRRSPPPPPPSRSTKPSAVAATAAAPVSPTAPPQALDSAAAAEESEEVTPPDTAQLMEHNTNTGTIPVPARAPAPANASAGAALSPQPSASSLDAQAFSPPDASLIQATSPDEPLGPGVSPDTTVTGEGMVRREVDGKVITVPADEIVRGVEDAVERQSESETGEST